MRFRNPRSKALLRLFRLVVSKKEKRILNRLEQQIPRYLCSRNSRCKPQARALNAELALKETVAKGASRSVRPTLLITQRNAIERTIHCSWESLSHRQRNRREATN